MLRPIMLWITSRSRSSMVSKIFVEHGVWWGNTLVKCSGYDTYENQKIKSLQNKYKPQWGRPYMKPIQTSSQVFEKFQRELAKIVPSDKTWMMKTGVEYFNAYESLNPYNIFIYRPAKDVAKSLVKKTKADYQIALKTAEWRYKYMIEIEYKHGGKWVNTDNVYNGDYSQVREALEYCGLVPDEEKIKKGITK